VFVEPASTWLIHVHAGSASVRHDDQALVVDSGATLLIDADASTRERPVIEGGGELVLVGFHDAASRAPAWLRGESGALRLSSEDGKMDPLDALDLFSLISPLAWLGWLAFRPFRAPMNRLLFFVFGLVLYGFFVKAIRAPLIDAQRAHLAARQELALMTG